MDEPGEPRHPAMPDDDWAARTWDEARRKGRRAAVWEWLGMLAGGVVVGTAATLVSWGGAALHVLAALAMVFGFGLFGELLATAGRVSDWDDEEPYPTRRAVVGALAGAAVAVAWLAFAYR